MGKEEGEGEVRYKGNWIGGEIDQGGGEGFTLHQLEWKM